jgi:hypothetical protein
MCVTVNERQRQMDRWTEGQRVCQDDADVCDAQRERVCVCEVVADVCEVVADVCDAHVCMRRCMVVITYQ